MAKYDALRAHLRRLNRDRVLMTFDEVAGIVPGGLPSSAYEHQAWWSNEERDQHVQARGWLGAGYYTADVSLTARQVTFVRGASSP